MTTKRFGKKFLRISGYVLGFLLVALVAFHFWFKAHARQLIEDLVESRSHGKIRLKVDKFKFNWFSKKMEFQDAVFYSTDSLTASTSYRFSVDRIKIKVDAILPIVFNKRIIIDTLTLLGPDIRVTRLKRSEKKEPGVEKDVSIPEEMGKIYNSIQEALQVLRVSRFLIDGGTFTLVNKIDPGQRPITIGNIFFQIDNLSVDTTIRGARDKILFSDNVILRSHKQDIVFPDERHRLSFSKFSINLQQKLVEFDSCTIAAIRTDSSSAAFTMYMDALKLIDIDFDTLYKTEVIKADSVYVVNPKFNLSVELGRKKDGGKPAPKLEDIIKQLTGDLQLDNVVVSNADFNIHTVKEGIPSSFTFSRNSFDMQGLTIDQDAATPIRVKSFSMAIRNYENFIRDSSYSVLFDSVLFRNDQIYLSNFVFHKLNEKGKIINTFNIPQFYLGGLSWDDLVFERKLKADQATLFNPRIDYTVSNKLRNKSGKASVFQSLASINEMMDLGYLDIIDGHIDLKVNEDIRIQLEQATLSIQSRDLLQSTQIAGIKNSLTSLDFRDGIIHAGDLVMKLKDIRYLGESGHFTAGTLNINDTKNNLTLDVEDIYVEKMLIDEKRGDILSENISWKKGKIKLRAGGSGKDLGSIIDVRNVRGMDTRLTAEFGGFELTTLLNELSFDRLDKRPGLPLQLSALSLDGEDLKLSGTNSTLRIGKYVFNDHQTSTLTDLAFQQSSLNGKSSITVPLITLTPFLESYISGQYRFDDVVVSRPRFDITLSGSRPDPPRVPGMEINSLVLDRPVIHFNKSTGSGTLSFQWEGENSPGAVRISGLNNRSDKGWDLSLQKLGFRLEKLKLLTPSGKKFNTGNGSLEAEIREISLRDKGQGMDWKATISELQAKDILLDSVGKKKNRLYIGQLFLQELGINTASVSNLETLTKANEKFRVTGFNGELASENSILSWYRGTMSRPGKTFSVDSMSWEPRLAMDSFMKRQLVQKDYIKLKTGAIRMEGADIDGFIRDNGISGKKMTVNDVVLDVTRDTRIRFDSGRIKALPVNMLRKISAPVQLDEFLVRNGKVFYSEIPANGVMATVPISQVDLKISNIKNADFNRNDSLFVVMSGNVFDSARVRLRMHESYLDSLGGFTLNVQFGPTRIGVLNPAFVPLGSLYIRSGDLDTATLSVIANEYLAFGEMNMRFRDLKLQLLKKPGSLDRKNTKDLLTFLANTFVIRNRNSSKPGVVFVIRNRERSVLNYLVKIATKGFQTSIGVGNNKKLTRQYKKTVREKGLQEF